MNTDNVVYTDEEQRQRAYAKKVAELRRAYSHLISLRGERRDRIVKAALIRMSLAGEVKTPKEIRAQMDALPKK